MNEIVKMIIQPEWLTAISTIVLALVAFITIFRDEILRRFQQPKFEVLFESDQPDCHLVPISFQKDVVSAFYVRCRIKNIGKSAARDVEVAVIEVRRKDAAGKFHRQSMATPWNLLWAHFNSHVLQQLPQGAERHITIGHVIDPEKRRYLPGEDNPEKKPELTLFCLEVFVRSNTLEFLLDPGEYEIDLQVSAANTKPTICTFCLNHTGQWLETEREMFTQGLGLDIKSKRY